MAKLSQMKRAEMLEFLNNAIKEERTDDNESKKESESGSEQIRNHRQNRCKI